jgi:hypothetical protein
MGLPIKELGELLNVYQCRIAGNCGFCTANKIRMQKHCNKVDQTAWKSNEATLCEKIKAQTFFQAGGLQWYFVVRAAKSSSALSITLEVADVVKERLAEWQLTQHAQEERAQVMDAQVAKTDKIGWFKQTGWLEHFANRNLMHLTHQTQLPDQGKAKLRQAAKLTELLVERSVKGLSTLAQETRRWLRSAKRQEVDQRPMARLQNPESQARYASYMVKCVCYALRLAADAEARMIAQESSCEVSDKDEDNTRSRDNSDNKDDNNVSDGNDNRPANHQGSSQKKKHLIKNAQELFHWTSRQKELVVALWEMLDSDANDNAQRKAQLEVLLNMLVLFVFTLTGDKSFSSGLVHFLAVLGIDSNTNRLRKAKNYSYMLAGVVYCMRVLSQCANCTQPYPRARPALSPEWRLAGDQIYTLAYVYLITYPRWIELQGIGGGTFPALDKAEIWICYSAHRVALSLRFASRLYMWLRCLGLGLSSLVG